MRTETVEVYSGPGVGFMLRRLRDPLPNVLVKGDTLHRWCTEADKACNEAEGVLSADAYRALNRLRLSLRSTLARYKYVLHQNDIPLPFSDKL